MAKQGAQVLLFLVILLVVVGVVGGVWFINKEKYDGGDLDLEGCLKQCDKLRDEDVSAWVNCTQFCYNPPRRLSHK